MDIQAEARKERIASNTGVLHYLFRQLSNDEISNDTLLDKLYEMGLFETSELTTFLRKRETSSYKFKDFLSALSIDVSHNNDTPSKQMSDKRTEGIFSSMSDEQNVNLRVRGSKGGFAQAHANRSGVADAITFDTNNDTMYQTSSGMYGSKPYSFENEYGRALPSRNFEMENERPRMSNIEKASAYSRETRKLSCPWGTESDMIIGTTQHAQGIKHKPQPSSGAWFSDSGNVSSGRSNASRKDMVPIWGTELDM